MFGPDTALMFDAIQISALVAAVTGGAVYMALRWTRTSKNRRAVDKVANSDLEERVRTAFEATGYKKPFQIKITLDDEAEFIDVKVKSGLDEETIGLKFETPDGRLLVRVDTDGDGR